ncbi:16S rRNA pseudouridine(516) synthase [Pseudomonas sp. LRF_L74]|uniref:16S rRNA pseudouridine(516) synthase n=1 Tax=Pseudomonas sp. LRF_L74 TaxID=3369422 RepID=UPI003F636C6A
MRLDRLLGNLPQLNRSAARRLIAEGRVRVDGLAVRDGTFAVRDFSRVEVDDAVVQPGRTARYFMLNKPTGVVSATEHPEHRTVLDLLEQADRPDLHIAGRLDLTTTGLLILTNDGLWSRRLTEPRSRLGKVYRVRTEQPILPEYVETFAQGMYFAYEDLTTLPAELQILDSHEALLTLHEGRYHQVKRMFGHFRNKVTGLHRERMGPLQLDPDLASGDYRPLHVEEIAQV